MGMVNLSLRRHCSFGRIIYRPICQDSEYILSMMKSGARDRIAFTEKEVAGMKALGWELNIKTEKEE